MNPVLSLLNPVCVFISYLSCLILSSRIWVPLNYKKTLFVFIVLDTYRSHFFIIFGKEYLKLNYSSLCSCFHQPLHRSLNVRVHITSKLCGKWVTRSVLLNKPLEPTLSFVFPEMVARSIISEIRGKGGALNRKEMTCYFLNNYVSVLGYFLPYSQHITGQRYYL
jgi:hypothetical protein